MSTEARAFVSDVSGWGQLQSTIFFLDTVTVWLIYSQVYPNHAVLLLAVLSTIKFTNVFWLYAAADYTPEYSDSTISAILIGLEFGWFVYDHIASLSTYYRILKLPHNKVRTMGCSIVLGTSLIVGLILRILRSMCRFGMCDLLPNADTPIAINVLTTEFLLLIVLIHYFVEFARQGTVRQDLAKEMISQGMLRVCLLVPFGIMESIGYAIEHNLNIKNSAKWYIQMH